MKQIIKAMQFLDYFFIAMVIGNVIEIATDTTGWPAANFWTIVVLAFVFVNFRIPMLKKIVEYNRQWEAMDKELQDKTVIVKNKKPLSEKEKAEIIEYMRMEFDAAQQELEEAIRKRTENSWK